jgi:hypothetical protein
VVLLVRVVAGVLALPLVVAVVLPALASVVVLLAVMLVVAELLPLPSPPEHPAVLQTPRGPRSQCASTRAAKPSLSRVRGRYDCTPSPR